MPDTNWTREELILALDLYRRLKGKIPDIRDSEIAALSSLLADQALLDEKSEARTGRSKASIIFKLSNFRSLDPEARNKGKEGFRNVGTLDKVIWKEFSVNRDDLAREAQKIRNAITRGRAEIEPLRANLHVLRLLGDELIGSPRLAVFELVKNAYDADAERVAVNLDLDSSNPSITVKDDGCGMSLTTIRSGWLQIGTPNKRGGNRNRTDIFHRLPLGEKGVGRLAAFKLGNRLEMHTREAKGKEYALVMDLDRILGDADSDQTRSVEDVRIRVRELEKPHVFVRPNDKGTLIRISKLRTDLPWTRRELRELLRLVNSLTSPFQAKGEFETSLTVPGHEHDIEELPDIKKVLEQAIWSFHFTLDNDGKYGWSYQFRPPAVFRGLQVSKLSSAKKPPDRLELQPQPQEYDSDLPSRPSRDKLFVYADDLKGIGELSGEFHVFDLRNEVLKHIGTKSVKMMLQAQGGIRVYRDGIRVFNYGEPGDDWLELNIGRVNRPGSTLATNSVVAGINLSLAESLGLKEKTNREGFDENNAFKRFKNIVQSVVVHLNTLRQNDRAELDRILKGEPLKEDAPTRFAKAVDEILDIAKDKGIADRIAKPVERLRKEYETLREVTVSSGAGLNLAIVFHEVEREVRGIVEGLRRGDKPDMLKIRADNLVTILDGFGSLIRKATRKTMSVSSLAERAIQLSKSRFEAHGIILSCPVLTGEDENFQISGAFNFYLTALLNLIDNAIYWTRRKAELEGNKYQRAIQIRTLPGWAAEGPSLAVLDNGPGFSINPDEAMRPFASTRPGGMGLGLYFARMAMEANVGDLLIPQSIDDLDIDTRMDGAAVVMRFRRVR